MTTRKGAIITSHAYRIADLYDVYCTLYYYRVYHHEGHESMTSDLEPNQHAPMSQSAKTTVEDLMYH